MDQPGLWEFPGGKIEPHESLFECIVREIQEELDCQIEPKRELDYPYHTNETIHLRGVLAKLVKGYPHPMEHSLIKWVPLDQLKKYPLCPADIPLLEAFFSFIQKDPSLLLL